MDAPTFADVRRGLVDTESLRIESMEKAGIELSMPSFNSPAEELERCVKQFGFKGVMVNGYSNTGLHRQ